jgi:AcrR family transcriptional regulator
MSANPGEKQAGREGKRPARERICETARDLFYQRGIRGVGVEMIAAEAGTTKMSLYRNFASKDELVAEYLCEQDRAFWKWWAELMEPLQGQPEKQIEALFKALREACCGPGARGCAFSNAAVELTDAAHPGRQIVLNHHEKVRHRLREICTEMKARDPEALGDALLLLISGAFMARVVFDKGDILDSVGKNVRALLHSELGPVRNK